MVTPKIAASHLRTCKNIMILTGAGLSAASGIPTFRGAYGFWTKSYEGYDDPTEILTMRVFEENPSIAWQWHYDFMDMLKTSKPNKGHVAIKNFMTNYKKA